MGLGNEPFFSGSLPSHGANYYILKLYKLSSSGFLFFGSSKLEFYTFYYHPKDFVGFTFLGHRGLFIPSLSLSTPASKGYTHHIHIGMAKKVGSGSLREGFITNFILNPLSNWVWSQQNWMWDIGS